MRPAREVLDSAVRALVGSQPMSEGKLQFAWRHAAGPAIARATSVNLRGTTLRVRADDAHWRREVRRLAPELVVRLATALGEGTVRRLTIVEAEHLDVSK